MPVLRASVFGSETLSLERRPAGTLRGSLVVVAAVVLAELTARAALAPLGRYWEYWTPAAARKFEAYRRMASGGHSPDVLIVGDSTGAADVDPGRMHGALGSGTSIFNLATSGNLATAFRASTLPLLADPRLAAPKLVVVALLPIGFIEEPVNHRTESVIRSSFAARHLRGEWCVADVLYLARLMPGIQYKRNWWTGGVGEPARTEGFEGLVSPPTSNEERLAIEGISVRLEAEGRTIDPDRFALWDELADVARRRSFRMIALVPPLRHRVEHAVPPFEADYMTRLNAKSIEHRFRVLDFRDSDFLAAEHFRDPAHLNVAGAALLSVRLATRIAPSNLLEP